MFDLGALGVYRLTIETDVDEDIEKIKEIASKYEGTEVKVNGH